MITKHCSTCTCGLILVEWSDRSMWIDPTNTDELVNCIAACAFDHYYDRTKNGIPYNLPSNLEKLLAPIVAEQMDKINSKWPDISLYPTEEQRNTFKMILRHAIES